MGKLTVKGNDVGTGTVILQGPNTNTPRTVTLPDATTTLVGTDTTQTLTNKTIQGGAIALDTVKTATGTAVDFTDIPSWVKRVTVSLRGVSTNGTSPIIVRLGTSGGFVTSGYLGTVTQVSTSGTSSLATVGCLLQVACAASSVYRCICTAINHSGTAWTFSGTGAFSDGPTTTIFANDVDISGTLTQVRVTTVNGTDTFDAGSINIIYEG